MPYLSNEIITKMATPPDPFYTLRPRAGEITALSFINHTGDSDRPLLISGTTLGRISIWDIDSKRENWKVVTSHEKSVIAVGPLGSNNVISQSHGGKIEIWDIACQNKLRSFDADDPRFCKLSVFTKDNQLGSQSCFAVASSQYGKVNIYDSVSGKLITTLQVTKPSSKGTCMCVKCNGNYLVAGFEQGSIVLFDYRKQLEAVSELKAHDEPVMCVHYLDNGLGVTGSADDVLSVFMITEMITITHKYNITLNSKGTSSVAIRNDGRIISAGGWDGRLHLYGSKKGKALASLYYHTKNIAALDFSCSSNDEVNNIIACGSRDGRISLWNLYQHVH